MFEDDEQSLENYQKGLWNASRMIEEAGPRTNFERNHNLNFICTNLTGPPDTFVLPKDALRRARERIAKQA